MSLTADQITAQNFKDFYGQIRPYLNGAAHSGFTPVGTVISVMGKTAPMNYLACDGTVYNIADYSELANYFAGQFEAANFFGGNGTTTFAVPDLRGEFLRGTGTNSHTNQGSGANVGVHQDGTEHTANYSTAGWLGSIGSPTHTPNDVTDRGKNHDNKWKAGDAYFSSGQVVTGTAGASDFSTYTSRPTNTSVLYCIATKNIFMDAGMNFSTEEQVVGTWIDSKPIYQKTFSGTSPSSDGAIQTGLTNVGFAYIAEGVIVGTGGYTANIAYDGVSVDVKNDGSEIYFYYSNNNFKSSQYYITIKYTKTT